MIDLNLLREKPELFRNAIEKKFIDFDLDAFLALDKNYITALTEYEKLRAAQNASSKEIPKLSGADKESKLKELAELGLKVKELEQNYRNLEGDWKVGLLKIPSIPLEIVPIGKDDTFNLEIRKVGEPRNFAFSAKSHVELGHELGILDIERGVKVAGSRNYFLIGQGARLAHALMNYAIDFASDRGFKLFLPPHIVNYSAMMGTGYFPGGEEAAYACPKDEKYLIGTAEVPVAAFHSGEVLDASELPKRYVGYSSCYRRESGTYGKDTQGIYRVHQFYKVEQVIISENDAQLSAQYHQELLKNAEDYLQSLELPYRVVISSTGDMGQGQVFKHDIETFMPSRKGYGETHSCSTFHDFQARRLETKYKDKNGKKLFCHTLNNTLAASARLVLAMLENHQESDGSIKIPQVLVPYMKASKIEKQ